jgi:hypothetical protein
LCKFIGTFQKVIKRRLRLWGWFRIHHTPVIASPPAVGRIGMRKTFFGAKSDPHSMQEPFPVHAA